MTLDARSLDAATSYLIEGLQPAGPWRCIYADRSEAVFATARVKLLVSTCDLSQVAPGRLRIDHLR